MSRADCSDQLILLISWLFFCVAFPDTKSTLVWTLIVLISWFCWSADCSFVWHSLIPSQHLCEHWLFWSADSADQLIVLLCGIPWYQVNTCVNTDCSDQLILLISWLFFCVAFPDTKSTLVWTLIVLISVVHERKKSAVGRPTAGDENFLQPSAGRTAGRPTADGRPAVGRPFLPFWAGRRPVGRRTAGRP